VVTLSTNIESHERAASTAALVECVLSSVVFGLASVWERDAAAWRGVLGYQAILSLVLGSGFFWEVLFKYVVLATVTSLGLLLLATAVAIDLRHKRPRDFLHYIGVTCIAIVYVRTLIGI
jgi:predicted membrane channel-forming protein YqfA (hemolysin III family)